MRHSTHASSPKNRLYCNKLDPGVFVVEVPETGRKISLGQPPDVIKRLQQVGYHGANGVTTFVLVDSKRQGDSISWCLTEFPILYALYFIMVEKNGVLMPAFHAGQKPMLAGLPGDVRKALAMIKYGNYGMDSIDEIDAMDIPPATREALRKEILGLAVGNVILDSESFIDSATLDEWPHNENEFTDLGDGIRLGHLGYNRYRFVYKDDSIDVDASLLPDEQFRAPVAYKHLKFPVANFGIWHTGEYDGMDPYYSCAHTSIIHKYEPVLVDYPSNMTDIINHHGLSKESINTVFVTHNHDDHIGAMVELFRRTRPCRVITTEPVRFSVVKKLAALVDLPEEVVTASFEWHILPFRRDKPYQTETVNFEGLRATGHLSCHSVPTTVYTFAVNQDGYNYTYGHFLDIVAFKRMGKMVKEGWMPAKHLDHLDTVIRKTPYSLIKYDAGCTSDASLPFTVHGQWQDLVESQTDRAFRVFTHAPEPQLDPAYESEGRFVAVGDLDSALRDPTGRLVRLGADKPAITAFYTRAFQAAWAYLQSLLDCPPESPEGKLLNHYAGAFANCPKHPDPNIGAFLFQQGAPSDSVIFIVRGRAEIIIQDPKGKVTFRSSVGDGEVVGDVGVLSGEARIASVKSLNRLSYLTIPSSLFLEAMEALGIRHAGFFKQLFKRRLTFQYASQLTRDLSTLELNRLARIAKPLKVRKGEVLYRKGEKDGRLLIAPKSVELTVGGEKTKLPGPTLIGECEFFLHGKRMPSARLHGAVAGVAMELLELEHDDVMHVPVMVDNLRRLIRTRRRGIYASLPKVDPVHP